MSQEHYTDEELLERLSKPDQRSFAFHLLVKKYQQRLYWHIRKIVIAHDDADDVLQNTLLKAWSAIESFRMESKIYTWLYRIATNEAITFLNHKRTRFFLPIVNVEKQLAETLEADEYFNGDEIDLKFQKALLKLPEKQRIVFNMKYFDDMKYEDISEILKTSVGAPKASYHHAVKKIEKYLETD